VDLGGFQEFVHHHDVQRECALAFTLCQEPFGTAIWFGTFRRTNLSFEVGKTINTASSKEYSGSVGVSSFTVKADDQDFLRATRTEDGSLRVVSINFEHPYFVPFFAHINTLRPPESEFRQPPGPGMTNEDVTRFMEPAISAFSPALRKQVEEQFKRVHDEDSEIRANFFGQLRLEFDSRMREIPLRPGNLAPVSARSKVRREQYSEDAESSHFWRRLEKCNNHEFFEDVAQIFCFEIEDLLDWFNVNLSQALESLTYLGPLRCYPPRHLVGTHDQDPNWFAGGGHAWDILRNDQNVVKKVNSWLASLQGQSANYELRVRYLKDMGRVSNAEKKRLADRLQQVGANNEAKALAAVDFLLADLAGDQMGTAFGEVSLLDRRTGLEVSHRDVGVGISQVLPVLVHAYSDQNQIVAIEQPEIHLHPALQAELGDVFIESAIGRKNTFILETHSEHLILRILRRVRETTEGKLEPGTTPIKPEDVSVVFVEPTMKGSVLRQLPVTPDGDFAVPWPGGFFADRFKDLP
jgi:hypothetical protein